MQNLLRQNLYSVWTPILFFTLIRLVVAPTFGLGVDEAHYLLYAKYLALSYFDHPPLVGWLHLPLAAIFGANEFTARIPAIVLGAGVTYFAYQIAYELTDNKKAAFWGVLALNSSFIFGALFIMMMPDTILIFLLLLLIKSFVKLINDKSLASYTLFGVVLGLCGLAKYTAIIFVVGIFIFIIFSKKYSLLLHKFTLFTVCAALLIISPVIIWNIENNFASFAYQGAHVAGSSSFSLATLGKNILIQFLAYSPPLFVIAFVGIAKLYKFHNDAAKLLFWLGISILIFFISTESLKPALPHWVSPFFVIFIVVGTALLFVAGYKKIVKYSVYFSFAITLLVYGELVFKFGSFPDLKSPFRDIAGWKDASIEAKKIKPNGVDIAVLNWSEGSRVAFYSNEAVFVADNRNDQFDIWYNQKPVGKDFLFILTKSSKNILAEKCICSDTSRISSYDARINGGLVEGFEYILCKNYQGLK